MREIVEKQWDELLPIWQRLYDHNTQATPFQSYGFLTFTGKGKPYRKDLFRLWGLKELNLVLYANKEPIAVAALLVKKKKEPICYMRGHFTAAGYLDFLYNPDWSYEDFQFLMDGIKSLLGDVKFQFDRIPGNSVTCTYMKEYFASGKIDKYESAYIPLTQSYDSWRQSLHKSVRQSMNNHRNRIKRDQINWSVEYYCGKSMDRHILRKMMLVYIDRFIIKNNYHFGMLSMLVKKFMLVVLLKDKMTQWVNKAENSFTAVLYMNNEIAAFANALICKDKKVTGIRFAISLKYARYSPGGVLISSIVKYFSEQNNIRQYAFDRLDMGYGVDGGMAYKYAYGGVTHYLYNFTNCS